MKPVVILYQPLPEKLQQKLSAVAEVKQFNALSLDCADFKATLAHAEGLLGAGGNIDKHFIEKPYQRFLSVMIMWMLPRSLNVISN